MAWHFHTLVFWIQRVIASIGVLVIITGVIWAIIQYVRDWLKGTILQQGERVNHIRLNLGRILILGLEFIVAADLISTISTPDYYSLGIVAIIVLIRTLLSFSLNRELASLIDSA